jgi:hypothetical protein
MVQVIECLEALSSNLSTFTHFMIFIGTTCHPLHYVLISVSLSFFSFFFPCGTYGFEHRALLGRLYHLSHAFSHFFAFLNLFFR